jgi:DNA-directed RNA polymerase subunit H (RpoH/RPB5)
MVMDRGFQIPGEDTIFDMTESQFILYLNDLRGANKGTLRTFASRFYVNEIGQRRTLLVYFANKSTKKKGDEDDAEFGKHKEKTLKGAIEPYIALLLKHVPDRSILIVSAPLGSKARDFMNENLANVRTIHELHYDEDLTYNPIYHVDVPRHELIPPDQVPQLLNEMKVSISLLPLMKQDEPIAKYYGWPVGSVIRIYRNDDYISILSPKSINYRVVI